MWLRNIFFSFAEFETKALVDVEESIYNFKKEKENFISCLNLFNSLIFQTLNYNGPRNYFSPIKEAEIHLFNSKNLNE